MSWHIWRGVKKTVGIVKQVVYSRKFCSRVNHSFWSMIFLIFSFHADPSVLCQGWVTRREYFLRWEGPKGWIPMETAFLRLPKVIRSILIGVKVSTEMKRPWVKSKKRWQDGKIQFVELRNGVRYGNRLSQAASLKAVNGRLMLGHSFFIGWQRQRWKQ